VLAWWLWELGDLEPPFSAKYLCHRYAKSFSFPLKLLVKASGAVASKKKGGEGGESTPYGQAVLEPLKAPIG